MSECPRAPRQEGLQKVLEISRALAASVDLNNLLGLIVNRAMELLEAERATVFIYDKPRNELYSRVAAGEGEIRAPADKGIAGATIQQNATINVPDVYKDDRFNPEVDRKTGFRTRNILSLPLRDHENGLVGVLQVLNRRNGAFSSDDVWLGEILASQAGVVLQREILIDHYVKKRQMERSMSIARDIQRGLLPAQMPIVEGFDIGGFSMPADETGGDVFDFMPLDEGRWMIIVADASGHGIGPALVIAQTRAMLRALCRKGDDLKRAIDTTNYLLAGDLNAERFVTCFFGLLEAGEGLKYISAGHGPMLFYKHAEDQFTQEGATGLPLGVMGDMPYEEIVTHSFDAGDFAVIATDGFFEAVNTSGEQFGLDRMMQHLRRDRDLPAQRMISNLYEAVKSFAGPLEQADDLTIIIIKRNISGD